MPYKDPEKQKAAQHESYLRHKELVYQRSRATRLANKKWLDEQKSRPCSRCEQSFPSYVMDFHHRDDEYKERTIANAIFMVGRDRVLAEIAKCDLLCSNCHRILHYQNFESEG